ncbi:hypothetical protein EMPS_03207 [Entomortierella parvispora]|uniref:PB1 domain-containing protein n=1 Tax=Entomortierella parvispora TaxID=205924 RepID=A0A9P3H6C4_9FUNG|nr:hypothetical protein EMPS_03207 [Entomortierella parvispora]
MAGLKYELDQWNEGVIAFDQGLYEDALEIFEPIADSAKIHFNIGVVLATLGDFVGASDAYTEATKLDQYLAIAYFQNGVANVALEDYAKALSCFHDAFLYLRGNMVIDYTQLGLDFKLYSCQVLFNRGLCYIECGEMDLGMTDLWRATREKQTKAHDVLDQALRDRGQDCTVFTVPQGVLYRPPESKVKNSKKKDYLGNSKVIAAIDASDSFAGFQGKSAWQVQMSGPTNVAAVEDPRPMTPPNALQRRATERVVGMGASGRARRGTDPERPQLEHAASFSGLDISARRAQMLATGSGASPLGQNSVSSLTSAGSEPRVSLLSRRNTDAQRPAPLNLSGNSNLERSDSNKSEKKQQQQASQYEDELDDIDQHVYALTIDTQEFTVSDTRSTQRAYGGNSGTSRPLLNHRLPTAGPSPPSSISNGQSSPPSRSMTPLNDLRRMGSNTSTVSSTSSGPNKLRRDDSIRSAASGSGGNYHAHQQPNVQHYQPSGYLDEPVYAGLRDKLRVKCHYTDTRAVLIRADTPLQELLQKVQDKFQSDRPLKLKYKDEDQHMLSMIDDEDWLMAQQVHLETMGTLDRIELWCFDDE